MTPELIALSRRLVACEGFRWMPGMRTFAGWRVVGVPLPDMVALYCSGYHILTLPPGGVAGECREPDLSDPATLGCLLALVREAHVSPHAYAGAGTSEGAVAWDVWGLSAALSSGCPTEAEALVAALEAAP